MNRSGEHQAETVRFDSLDRDGKAPRHNLMSSGHPGEAQLMSAEAIGEPLGEFPAMPRVILQPLPRYFRGGPQAGD